MVRVPDGQSDVVTVDQVGGESDHLFGKKVKDDIVQMGLLQEGLPSVLASNNEAITREPEQTVCNPPSTLISPLKLRYLPRVSITVHFLILVLG